ncbi:PH domain-containing protein [Streptomyces sp. NBC_00005]|uniref:PH domain-containing protein n=1 Tax=Streptomyces sp. NBC_00005 TaxID=2903609 RepID=UPI00324F0491
MDKTIFRYTRRQRGAMWGFALGLGVWAGAACVRSSRLLADHQTGGAAGLFLLLGLLPLVLFVVLVGMSTGITRIDAHGLRTRGMTGRKRVPWDRIESIDALGGLGRRGTITRIRVTRSDGRPLMLPVPFSSGTIAMDPDLHDKVALMRREWKKHRAPPPGDTAQEA